MPKFLRSLFGQVVLALILGVILGGADPDFAVALKPLGDGFIKLIKMIIAPIVFCVVVLGIAAGDLKKVGRVGIKAVVYFEIVTTFALLIGVILAYALQPGVGMNIDPSTLDASAMSAYADRAGEVRHGTVDFLLKIIPTTVTDAFAKGDILQVLLFAILFGARIVLPGRTGRPGGDLHRADLAHPVRDHVLHRPAGSAGRAGRHRLHGRQVRRRLAGPARHAGADLLRVLHRLRAVRAWADPAGGGLQHRSSSSATSGKS